MKKLRYSDVQMLPLVAFQRIYWFVTQLWAIIFIALQSQVV